MIILGLVGKGVRGDSWSPGATAGMMLYRLYIEPPRGMVKHGGRGGGPHQASWQSNFPPPFPKNHE